MSLNANDIAGLAAAIQKLSTGSTTTQPTTSAVALKLPTFWRDEPVIWFEQVEAAFATKGITNDQTKRDYVLGALDNDTAKEVKQAIINPPQEKKYDALKNALTSAFDRTQDQKDAELLALTDIGDRRPTAHLRYLRNLNSNGVSLMRAMFLSHLPADVRTIVQAQGLKDLDQLAEAADRAMDAKDSRPCTAAINRGPKTKRSNTNKRDNTQERDRSQEHSLCHFHKRSGKQARRCAPGCIMYQPVSTNALDLEDQGNE